MKEFSKLAKETEKTIMFRLSYLVSDKITCHRIDVPEYNQYWLRIVVLEKQAIYHKPAQETEFSLQITKDMADSFFGNEKTKTIA